MCILHRGYTPLGGYLVGVVSCSTLEVLKDTLRGN